MSNLDISRAQRLDQRVVEMYPTISRAFAGIGSEIAAVMMEECFDWLDAPVKRVAGKDVPLPYAANLERFAVPQVEDIVAAAHEVTYR